MLALALACGACAGQGDTAGRAEDAVLASFAASATTRSNLGIESWEVRGAEPNTEILGFDAQGNISAELLLDGAAGSSDVVHVTAVLPETGELTLSRAGEVAGDVSSDSLRALVQAAYSDSLDPSARRSLDSASPAPGLGSRSESLRLDSEGAINMGWSFFGYSNEVLEGNWCSQGAIRSFFSAASDHGASCWVVRWNSSIPTDCRILVHYGIGGFQTDVCRWYVYTQ